MKTLRFFLVFIVFSVWTFEPSYASEPSMSSAEQESSKNHATSNGSTEPANRNLARGKTDQTDGKNSKSKNDKGQASKPKEENRDTKKDSKALPAKSQVNHPSGRNLRLPKPNKSATAVKDVPMKNKTENIHDQHARAATSRQASKAMPLLVHGRSSGMTVVGGSTAAANIKHATAAIDGAYKRKP